MKLENIVDWCKRVYLRNIIGYKDPHRYWNRRWALRLLPSRTDYTGIYAQVRAVMDKHGCKSVLEVGCGRNPLSALPGYIGLDFSQVALEQSGLRGYVYADLTHGIPLPTKSVDAVYSGAVLMHIPEDGIEKAVSEIMRVCRKCVILAEPTVPFDSRLDSHYRDLGKLFDGFGDVVFLDGGR